MSQTLSMPAVGIWTIDNSHSSLDFKVRHLMAAKVKGRFSEISGNIVIDPQIEKSSVSAEIKIDSIDTHNSDRDGHLKSEDFFDSEKFPTATYKSTNLVQKNQSEFLVEGELTIKGITKKVDLEMEFNGVVQDPWGNSKAVFSATGSINREDFGLTWNQALETGGVLIGKNIQLEIELETIYQQ